MLYKAFLTSAINVLSDTPNEWRDNRGFCSSIVEDLGFDVIADTIQSISMASGDTKTLQLPTAISATSQTSAQQMFVAFIYGTLNITVVNSGGTSVFHLVGTSKWPNIITLPMKDCTSIALTCGANDTVIDLAWLGIAESTDARVTTGGLL